MKRRHEPCPESGPRLRLQFGQGTSNLRLIAKAPLLYANARGHSPSPTTSKSQRGVSQPLPRNLEVYQKKKPVLVTKFMIVFFRSFFYSNIPTPLNHNQTPPPSHSDVRDISSIANLHELKEPDGSLPLALRNNKKNDSDVNPIRKGNIPPPGGTAAAAALIAANRKGRGEDAQDWDQDWDRVSPRCACVFEIL